jgi:hypothetical protein
MHYGVCNQDGKISLAIVKSMLKMARIRDIGSGDSAVAYWDSLDCLEKNA